MTNPAEYYDLQIQLIELLNSIFQIWLGFTFGAIVAFHIGSAKLNIVLLCLVELLYILASLVFVARYFHTATVIGTFNEVLVSAGHAPYPTPGSLVAGSMLLLFLVGTFGTTSYGVYTYRKQARAA